MVPSQEREGHTSHAERRDCQWLPPRLSPFLASHQHEQRWWMLPLQPLTFLWANASETLSQIAEQRLSFRGTPHNWKVLFCRHCLSTACVQRTELSQRSHAQTFPTFSQCAWDSSTVSTYRLPEVLDRFCSAFRFPSANSRFDPSKPVL